MNVAEALGRDRENGLAVGGVGAGVASDDFRHGVLAGRKLAQLRVAPAAAQSPISGTGGATDAPGLRGMAAMSRLDPPAPLPPFAFTDADGRRICTSRITCLVRDAAPGA